MKSIPTTTTVIELSENWLRTVQTHEPNAVTSLYADEGVLIGTVADTLKQGHSEIIEYFHMFLAKENLRGEFHDHLVQTNDGWAIDSGNYTFRWEEGGTTVEVPARFSFVYVQGNDGWKIANHHSSAHPAGSA